MQNTIYPFFNHLIIVFHSCFLIITFFFMSECPRAWPPLAPALGVQVGEGLTLPQTGAQGWVLVWGCFVLFCSAVNDERMY